MMKQIRNLLMLAITAMVVLLLIAGCESPEEETAPETTTTFAPQLSMDLPDSLTGGTSIVTPTSSRYTPLAAGDDPCAFNGQNEQNWHDNGYKMARFMVGAVASWSCLADQIMMFTDIFVALGWPTDGTTYPLENNNSTDPNPVTAMGILVDDSADPARREVRLFWGEASPGVANTTDAGMFFAWDTSADGTVSGRVVVDAAALNGSVEPEGPTYMRMDFSITSQHKIGEMFLAFEAQNEFTNAFRIKVTKNLDGANPLYEVMGNIDVKAQFDTRFTADHPGYTPSLKMYAISNGLGHGAAVARIADLGFRFAGFEAVYEIPEDPTSNIITSDHLGAFLFTKDDTYYFTNLGNGNHEPVYVNKAVYSASYLGGKLFDQHGYLQDTGVWIYNDNGDPVTWFGGVATEYSAEHAKLFETPEEWLDWALMGAPSPIPTPLTPTYSNCTAAPGPSTDCVTFLNAVFQNDDFGQAANMGTEPDDYRKPLIDAATYLDTSCPNDAANCEMDETEVFQMQLP
ncbi:MAG: hypothetical protein OEZ59_01080 [Deltaproteobacteria bacterium]|nr:hypothetical protein [Deltaproteobacteria bacterium]